ncbi:MAG TPA: hypothetical protein PKN61_09175 [Acidobacteriota bacterium]|jgi:hypothetical protein|nr:hypothetical protein [Acidobacteriota bacterium]HNU01053.1 hypothetical protein [Acidobacteriota bacterium]
MRKNVLVVVLYVALACAALLGAPPLSEAQTTGAPGTSAEVTRAVVVLEGTLVKTDGTPVAGRTVYAIPIRDGQPMMVVRLDNMSQVDPEAHAHAKTNAKGYFSIRYGGQDGVEVVMRGDKLMVQDAYEGFTVGVLNKGGTFTLLKPEPRTDAPPTWKLQSDQGVLLIRFGKTVMP